jgi:hypothetical protein
LTQFPVTTTTITNVVSAFSSDIGHWNQKLESKYLIEDIVLFQQIIKCLPFMFDSSFLFLFIFFFGFCLIFDFLEYLGKELLPFVYLNDLIELLQSAPSPIPVERVFNNEGTPLRENLPASLNSEENILDLSCLSGDLGDPNGTSPTVNGILKNLRNSKFRVHILEGVSGCGKTKALRDVGRHHFLLFFTFYTYSSAPDVQECQTTCSSILERSKPQKDYPIYIEKCRIAINLMLFQRILAFFVLRQAYPQLTSWQWIMFQISFSFVGSPQQAFLENAISCIDQSKEWPPGMIASLTMFVNKLRSDNRSNEKFLIAFDEAQALLNIGTNMFPLLIQPQVYNRSFYFFS